MFERFVHCHLHTEYSIVDGMVRIDDLISRTKEQGAMAVAITDQSNLFAMVKFYQAAIAHGIKPIIGVEIWVLNEQTGASCRVVLLCQNARGYQNMTQLVSRSYIDGQKNGRPQVYFEWLKEHSDGLIALHCSLEGVLTEALLSEDLELAKEIWNLWSEIFPNRLYLEVVKTGRLEEKKGIQFAVYLSEKIGCPLVASNDVRFLEKGDFEAHEARVCIQQGYTLNDPNRLKIYSEEQYLKSPEEMAKLFSDLPEALANSVEIAKRCNFQLELGRVYLPDFPVPKGQTVEHYMQQLAEQGLVRIFENKSVPQEYQERLAIELSVLNRMGYAGYFLIVADFIQWAKNNGVPVGPGRGSGAGSLVAYALGITGIDPIQYELLFERFLNPERVSMPDFDIDFCMDGRDRVIDYVARTYGRQSVSQIITYGTMAARAVIRDVGRVLGHPYGFVDKLAKLIPHELGITLKKAILEEETLKQRYHQEEEVKLFFDLAMKLEGVVRNAGKHAGGVVIAPSKLTDFTPLYCDSEGTLLTQFDKNDVESIGLVKFDFLGLKTLTIIHSAVRLINQVRQSRMEDMIDIETINLQDEKVFSLLRSCQTVAVFQLESRGMRDLLKRLQPDNFEEIIALVALFRPGPLQSGMVDDFINRKHGRAIPEYLHPKLIPILKPTYGVILYQEQVMQIAQVLSGYSLGEADLLRRAMGKKKPEEMALQREIFVKGSTERGVERSMATHIFDLMEKFAGYGFNKSHSAAYALITYQTAWIKTHFPSAFMAAALSADMAHTDKIMILVEECKRLKIPLLPPNINTSEYHFSVTEKLEIRYGLGAIKGVGELAIQAITETRKTGEFTDLINFCSRIDLKRFNKRVLEALIRSGAFDAFRQERSVMLATLSEVLHIVEQYNKTRDLGQEDLFGELDFSVILPPMIQNKSVPPWTESERLQAEKDSLGLYLSGHPLDHLQPELTHLRSTTIRDLHTTQGLQTIVGLVVAVRTLLSRRGEKMAFVTIDDSTGMQEVVIFSDLYHQYREKLVKEALLVIQGEVSIDNFSGGHRIRCVNIHSYEEAHKSVVHRLNLTLVQDLRKEFIVDLKKVLKNHEDASGCAIHLRYRKDEAIVTLQLGSEWRVDPSAELLKTLRALQEVEKVELEY